MNKTAIKNFAIWARNKLIAEITYKAGLLGITDKKISSPLSQSTEDVQFFDIGAKEPYIITGMEIEQRSKLVEVIRKKEKQSDYIIAYNSVVEEVAYTWFNRLIAVRFMEVNDYLPSRIRVLSSESSSKIEPDLVTSPFDAGLDYDPYEKDLIMQLKTYNQLDELFRMLFIKQCNALNAILPNLFEKTNDYTELLMNVSFTDKNGIVYRLVHDIPEDDFNVEKEGQIEIIGWLYQYYNTEPKDETFALLKKNVKITKERIPAATQLFTPDWIVRYMVENSLGRLWLEGHPNGELKAGWKYYLDEAEQEPDVQEQLNVIREEYKSIRPEDIKVIDPCMGSGHILVYAFDVLMQIYESYGYSQRDAAKSIVENNLYGLDIDNRAYQLAYFAVMMKARQYNRRILDGETNCQVLTIQESNGINRDQLQYFGHDMIDLERNIALNEMEYLIDTMHDAKEYGSILSIDNLNWELLHRFVENIDFYGQLTLDAIGLENTQKQLRLLVEVADVLAQKYDAVVTNPPYLGSSGMGVELSDYLKSNYPETKSDMSTVCMEKTLSMCKPRAYMAMINIPVWMSLSSYEKLRERIIKENTFINMIHFGRGIFGSDFGTTSFVIQKQRILDYAASYRRLFKKQGAVDSVEQKEKWFFEGYGKHTAKQENFSKIPGMSITYWVSETVVKAFSDLKTLADYAPPKAGLSTADNERFLRFWWEVDNIKICFSGKKAIELQTNLIGNKWFPMTKGGGFRKWYGNNEYILNFEQNGKELKHWLVNNPRDPSTTSYSRYVRNYDSYFQAGISFSDVTAGNPSFRYQSTGYIPNARGPYIYSEDYPLIGYLNSKVARYFLNIVAPTLTYNVGDVARIPCKRVYNEILDQIVTKNIEQSAFDWDSFETSWDFKVHPLAQYQQFVERYWDKLRESGILVDHSLLYVSNLEHAYEQWKEFTVRQFDQLKANEEELNQIFIDIYGLQGELSPDVEDKEITITKIVDEQSEEDKKNRYCMNKSEIVRSLISYAVGCMVGRYSLDEEGLAYAGGDWDNSKYTTFILDRDNVIPIPDEQYFEDDIVGLFCAFLKMTFSEDTLEHNLDFIAKALGNKGNSSREIIRNYFLKDFFKDHCKIYQKRPIYWLFDSGKADGFKALVYMHRYNADTIGNLRIDYLHRMQRVYDSEISRMQETIDNSGNAREVTVATKRKEKLTKQLQETKEYDEKIAHLALARTPIDLDDGVKINYEKVQTDIEGNRLVILANI